MPSVVRGAIDCGANSVHLLVGTVDAHQVRPLADESILLGLGVAAATGHLGASARERLVAAVGDYARIARGLGAAEVIVVGTEPLRRARDARAAVEEVATTSGLELVVIEREEEAFLTLIGATGGRRVDSVTLVCDVGGGSTELALVGPRQPAVAFGLQLGSAVLASSVVHHDPPDGREIQALRDRAGAALAEAPAAKAERVIAVGGSATNLLRLLPGAELERSLDRTQLEAILHLLGAQPAAVVAEAHGINPLRARVLPAGAAILDAVLARYGHDELAVSDFGIRDGILLAVSRAGAAWRSRLAELANGWSPPLSS